jgi:hypothetical protein
MVSFGNKILLPIIIFLLVIAVGSAGAAGYLYLQNQKLTQVDKEIQEVQAMVGRHMLLPDEIPTIATVADKEKLQGQAFFRNAEKDDKVLIYPIAGRAILFRPKTQKIIEVAPFRVESGSGTQPITPGQEMPTATPQSQIPAGSSALSQQLQSPQPSTNPTP